MFGLGTKAELLSRLDEGKLQRLAKKEGLKVILKTFGKRDLVKYLEGVLTLEQVKEYVGEYYEREIEREVIREKIRERGVKVAKRVATRVTFDRSNAILEIQRREKEEKISQEVLEQIAEFLHEPPPSGRGFSLYDGMSDKLLKTVYQIFVRGESLRGRGLEFRFANWLLWHLPRNVVRLKIRHNEPPVGELDVVGFDPKDNIVVMAECKDRPIGYEDITKWISNAKTLYNEGGFKLEEAYMVCSAGYTEGTLERMIALPEVDDHSGALKMGLGITARSFLLASDIKKAGKVQLKVFDFRDGHFIQVFPKRRKG